MLCLVTQSCPTLCNPMDSSPPGSSVHGDSPAKNIGVGCHAVLQGIFPIQGSNPGLPHCGWVLYLLNHLGSSRILEWVAYLSPGDLPDPGIKLGSPALQVAYLPAELPGKSNCSLLVLIFCCWPIFSSSFPLICASVSANVMH